jgi:hypothetical protein
MSKITQKNYNIGPKTKNIDRKLLKLLEKKKLLAQAGEWTQGTYSINVFVFVAAIVVF